RVGAHSVARDAGGGVGGVDKNPAEIKRTTARTLRLRPSSLNHCRGWTVHGREFSFPTLATGDERGQVRERRPTEKCRSSPVGATSTRYGRLTVVLSPTAEITKVPDAVSLAKAYGLVQPAGGSGIFAMNGPAGWPGGLTATNGSTPSPLGTIPLWAA